MESREQVQDYLTRLIDAIDLPPKRFENVVVEAIAHHLNARGVETRVLNRRCSWRVLIDVSYSVDLYALDLPKHGIFQDLFGARDWDAMGTRYIRENHATGKYVLPDYKISEEDTIVYSPLKPSALSADPRLDIVENAAAKVLAEMLDEATQSLPQSSLKAGRRI